MHSSPYSQRKGRQPEPQRHQNQVSRRGSGAPPPRVPEPRTPNPPASVVVTAKAPGPDLARENLISDALEGLDDFSKSALTMGGPDQCMEDNRRLRGANSLLLMERHQLSGQNDSLQREFKTLQLERATLSKKNANLMMDRDQRIERLEKDCWALRKSAAQVEKERVQIEIEHQSIKAERDLFVKERAGLCEECCAYRYERDTQKTKLEALRLEIARLTENFVASQTQSAARKRDRTTYEADSNDGSTQVGEVERGEESLRKKRAAASAQLVDEDQSSDGISSGAAVRVKQELVKQEVVKQEMVKQEIVKQEIMKVETLDVKLEAAEVKVEKTE